MCAEVLGQLFGVQRQVQSVSDNAPQPMHRLNEAVRSELPSPMIRALLLATTCALAGCAVSTGAVPRAEGMYTVTKQGAGFWIQTPQLTAEASAEADKQCSGMGKKLKVLHSKESPAGLGRFPESEVLFRCD